MPSWKQINPIYQHSLGNPQCSEIKPVLPLAFSISHHGNHPNKYFFGRFQDGNSEALQASANTGLTLKDCLLGNGNPWIYSSAWHRLFCLVSPFLMSILSQKEETRSSTPGQAKTVTGGCCIEEPIFTSRHSFQFAHILP